MSSNIIYRKNRVREDIKHLEHVCKHSLNTLNSFSETEANKYTEKKILELESTISRCKSDIDVLKEELYKLDTNPEETTIYDSSGVEKQKVSLNTRERREMCPKKPNTYFFENKYEEKHREREYESARRYYVKTCESIPDFILNNLENMPNNKGYIWRDVYCYGKLPDDKSGIITMFLKQKGGLTIIHETTDKEHRVYHKQGSDRKVLVSKKTRYNS